MVGSDSVNKSLPVNGAVEEPVFIPACFYQQFLHTPVHADTNTYYINDSQRLFLCFICVIITLRKTVSKLFKEIHKFYSFHTASHKTIIPQVSIIANSIVHTRISL